MASLAFYQTFFDFGRERFLRKVHSQKVQMVACLLTELTYLWCALTLNREKWWKMSTTTGEEHDQNGCVIQIVTHLAR